jgi:hypothetical protein
MAHGKKKAKIHPSFEKRVQDLKEKAQKTAQFFRTLSDFSPWNVPEQVQDILDVAALHKGCFERDDVNQEYCQSVLTGDVKSSGTVADLIALNWQADFISSEERAFRTRHASYTRCKAMAHGRLNKHGNDKSVFLFLKEGAQSIIDAGATGGS